MIIAAISACVLALTIVNFFSMRKVSIRNGTEINSSVSILVPMRNEESNVEGVLHSILQQENLTEYEVLVLNDNSTDRTGELLRQIDNPVLTVHQGEPLPNGWLGKTFACQQLAHLSTGEFLVFIDADVRLQRRAIAAAITTMEQLNWDFISPYPREIAVSFAEKLIQPLLQWSWLASVPLRLAERFPNRSMTIANGQFFIVRSAAYQRINGHSAIAHEVLDDLELARSLITNGFAGGVAEGSDVATCRMYESSTDLILGYTKSLWRAFGGPVGTGIAVLLLVATGIIPIVGALLGWGWAQFAFMAIWASRIIAAVRTKTSATTAVFHPLSIAFLIVLIAQSWYRKFNGTLVWRDRVISS